MNATPLPVAMSAGRPDERPKPEIETPKPDHVDVPAPDRIDTPAPDWIETPKPDRIDTPGPDRVDPPAPGRIDFRRAVAWTAASVTAWVGLVGVTPAQDVLGRRIITRQDLAEVVQVVDVQVTAGQRLAATESLSALARTNDEFDRISRLFLGAQLGEAMDGLSGMAEDLGCSPESRTLNRLRADVWANGGWRGRTLQLESALAERPDSEASSKSVRVRLRTVRSCTEYAGEEIDIEMDEWSLDDGSTPRPMTPVGTARFDERGCLVETELTLPIDGVPNGGLRFKVGDELVGVDCVTSPLGGVGARPELEARAAALGDVPAGGIGALRAFRSRLSLGFEAPSTETSAEFLLTRSHTESLRDELEALERGDDPYAGRPGDHWRTFTHGRRDLAARVYLPSDAPAEKLPLVIAFHGAGGDESFLFELGGDGHIKTLADRHGCLVVAPFTPDFLFSAKPLDSLLAGIAEDFPIDLERVFLLGHSMGAMATRKLAEDRADRIAGACCVAGFSRIGAGAPPILVVQGERDRIVPTRGVRAAVEASPEADVTYVELEDQGHTLLLPAALDLAFARWFE